MFTLGLVWETLSYISLFIEFTSNVWDPLIISCNTTLIIAFFWTVIITFFFKVVDAVLSVKMTNQRGEIKYPIKVCLCSSVKVLNIVSQVRMISLCLNTSAYYVVGDQYSESSWTKCERQLFVEGICTQYWTRCPRDATTSVSSQDCLPRLQSSEDKNAARCPSCS